MSDRHTPDFKQYVLGFRFSKEPRDCIDVVLIHKNRPPWQAGLYNAPGGHVEEGETAILAVVREFREETGMETAPRDWDHFVTLSAKDYDLHCFRSFGPIDVKTTTEEEVIVASLPINEAIIRVVHNLHWLVPMALDESVVGDYHSANVVNVE